MKDQKQPLKWFIVCPHCKLNHSPSMAQLYHDHDIGMVYHCPHCIGDIDFSSFVEASIEGTWIPRQ